MYIRGTERKMSNKLRPTVSLKLLDGFVYTLKVVGTTGDPVRSSKRIFIF